MSRLNIKLPLFILIVLAVFIELLSVDSFADKEDEPFRLEVEAGFNGIGKLGAWTPLHVKALSSEKDISGELQVEANLDQSRKIIIAKPVEIKTGVEYEFYFEVPVVSAHRNLDIKIVDKKKNVVAQADFDFTRLLPPDIALIGVLSDDPSAFAWLSGNTIPVTPISDEKLRLMIAAGEIPPGAQDSIVKGYKRREAVAVPLSRDSFPENTEVMDGFDFLVISNYDTGLLSEAQVETLEKWVDAGGILIMGTGLNWQKVYNGLPDNLKLFKINGTVDIDSTEELKKIIGGEVPEMVLKLAVGEKGFEYYPRDWSVAYASGASFPLYDNDVIAGSGDYPLVIKYQMERGSILVFTFEPASEPFVSWRNKTILFDYVLNFVDTNAQRFYEYRSGYFQKQSYGSPVNLRYIANEIPYDREPPLLWMFIGLAVYIILVGPVMYLVLKKYDRRDWAWLLIPALSVVFLFGMYLFGFKSRYHSAITNTVSIIQAAHGANEASITSTIGIFNDRRGTLKMEYSNNNGIQTPFVQNTDHYLSSYLPISSGSGGTGTVFGKLTIGDRMIFEQYDVMLWTPTMINAKKTVPFAADILRNIYIRDGRLRGEIVNTTQFDFLDAVIVIGNNIIPAGDIYSGETSSLDIPFDDSSVYKRPDEYLDSEFCRTSYRNYDDYPENYAELRRNRRIFENVIYDLFNSLQGNNRFVLLARNDQEIDYGLVINGKEPQKYNMSLIRVDSNFEFKAGQEVEIPGGLITPLYYQTGEVGWQEGMNSIRVHDTGPMEFVFMLPENLDVTEMRLLVEGYVPLYVKYRMAENTDNKHKIEILKNEYEYYLYNAETNRWDIIENDVTITDNPGKYIGAGGEVRMMINVVSLAQEDSDMYHSYPNGTYVTEYQQEILSVPEISLKGVAR